LNDCVEKTCHCSIDSTASKYDMFLKRKCDLTTMTEVIEIKPIENQEVQHIIEKEEAKEELNFKNHWVKTVFTVDFTVLPDTCCLDFSWEFFSGVDEAK